MRLRRTLSRTIIRIAEDGLEYNVLTTENGSAELSRAVLCGLSSVVQAAVQSVKIWGGVDWSVRIARAEETTNED